MSLTCPVDLDVMMLRREASAMYARVATSIEVEFHFHRGSDYAARLSTTKDRTARRDDVMGVNLSAIRAHA